jgi:hypothetical protein
MWLVNFLQGLRAIICFPLKEQDVHEICILISELIN